MRFSLSSLSVVFATTVVAFVCLSSAETASAAETVPQLKARIEALVGDDTRLIRHDATKHTASKQPEFCEESVLTDVLTELVTKSKSAQENADWLYLAADYATLCLVDNPQNREVFSKVTGIYQAVADLIHTYRQAEDPVSPHDASLYHLHRLPAKGAQLVYTSVFGNSKNHVGYFEDVTTLETHYDGEDPNALKLGIMESLLAVLEDYAMTLQSHIDHKEGVLYEANLPPDEVEGHELEPPEPTQILPLTAMWAASALQNMAASYCDTESRKCGWEYNMDTGLLRLKEGQTIISDGHAIRKAMVRSDSHFLMWDMGLETLICNAPTKEVTSTLHGDKVKYDSLHPASETKLVAAHDTSHADHDVSHELMESLVPWAVTGLVRNLAIDASDQFELRNNILDPLVPCLCTQAKKSIDIYEQVFAGEALARMRPVDPCWFSDTDGATSLLKPKASEDPGISETGVLSGNIFGDVLCVDDFLFEDGKTCGNYRYIDDDKCDEMAKMSCCACGGGSHVDDQGYEEDIGDFGTYHEDFHQYDPSYYEGYEDDGEYEYEDEL